VEDALEMAEQTDARCRRRPHGGRLQEEKCDHNQQSAVLFKKTLLSADTGHMSTAAMVNEISVLTQALVGQVRNLMNPQIPCQTVDFVSSRVCQSKSRFEEPWWNSWDRAEMST